LLGRSDAGNVTGMPRSDDKWDPESPPVDRRSGNIVFGLVLAMSLYFVGMQLYQWIEPWLH
jgi:hypothetical protein